MIADLAPGRSAASLAAADETTDLVDVAFAWVTLNALDCVEIDRKDSAVVRTAHVHLRNRLDALGITSADIFEHIADAVERGDWGALGIPNDPDDAVP